jgi:hypothetical protein
MHEWILKVKISSANNDPDARCFTLGLYFATVFRRSATQSSHVSDAALQKMPAKTVPNARYLRINKPRKSPYRVEWIDSAGIVV